MRNFVLIGISVIALASCGSTGQTVLTVACAADGLAPTLVTAGGAIAVIADPADIGAVQAMNAADQVAHPAVQAACAAALPGSKPVAGTVAPATVPVAPVVAKPAS